VPNRQSPLESFFVRLTEQNVGPAFTAATAAVARYTPAASITGAAADGAGEAVAPMAEFFQSIAPVFVAALKVTSVPVANVRDHTAEAAS
jgi:hypothetical protein